LEKPFSEIARAVAFLPCLKRWTRAKMGNERVNAIIFVFD